MSYTYRVGQELPAMAFAWTDRTNTVIDYSTGWTFTAKVCTAAAPTTTLLTKTTGITGAATSPNITVDWTTTDLSALTAAATGTDYVVHLIARRTADSKDRQYSPGKLPTFTLFPAAS
jgi:hypothetical protein